MSGEAIFMAFSLVAILAFLARDAAQFQPKENPMTFMDKVKQINSDIIALPKEYRTLVLAEQNWSQRHPVLYAVALVGMGVFLGLLISL